MNKIIITLFFSLAAFYSCTKKENPIKTYTGTFPIVNSKTPSTSIAGENITSRVYFELSSISGSIIFQGFEIKELANKNFNISAKALYKDWNTQVTMPVISTFDTTLNIMTHTPGQYVLNFFNSTQLVKSDTVQVN